MKKILIVGCPGSGKSTFAEKLAKEIKVPLIHLDSIYWKPNWERPSKKEWIEILNKVLDKKSWIIDGNYVSTFELRAKKADTIYFFETPRWKCILRALKRFIKYKIGSNTRKDLAENCHERIDLDFLKLIWNYNKGIKPTMEKVIKKIKFKGKLIRIRN